MKRRITIVFLCAALLMGICGCSATDRITGNSNDTSSAILSTPDDTSGMPPYKYTYVHVSTMEEVAEFVKNNDPDKFYEGQYKTMIEAVRDNGFLLEPYYDEKSVLQLPQKHYTDGTPFPSCTLIFEMKHEGVGYWLDFEANSVQINIAIHYLPNEQIKEARNSPYNYPFGKEKAKRSLDDVTAAGWQSVFLTLNESSVTAFKLPFEKTRVDKEYLVFVYDEFLVRISVFGNDSGIDTLDIAQHLTFNKISIDKLITSGRCKSLPAEEG